MTPRVYLVGTDTGVGKTTVACALLSAARRSGHGVLPFKPAQTGPDDPSDAQRLAAAAGLSPSAAASICPHTWPAALAPGIAEDPAAFTTPCRSRSPTHAIARARADLQRWCDDVPHALVLVEGVGGLHVPMPGGTWQPHWIVALATHTLVVARAGLGTIHHTVSVIASLRALGRPPLAFVLSAAHEPDASHATNAAVIATHTGVPCWASFPADPEGQAVAADATLAALRAALAPR